MRSVFSAIRRSLTSATMVLASSKHGARRMSRSVARTGMFLSRRLSGALRSSNVMHGLLESEEGSRHVSPLGTRVGPPVRWEPADLDEVYRLIGPQPPSSAEPIRTPGPWLWYGTRRDR